MELSWYALRTSPEQRLMELAIRVLRGQGFVCDMAKEQRLRRRTRHDKVRKLQTFTLAPGYVFCAAPHGAPMPWREVFKHNLVHSVVSMNGEPAALSDKAVRTFLGIRGDDLPMYHRFLRTGQEFKIGDEVIVQRGALADFRVKIIDVREGEAFFILRLLGRDQEVGVSVDDVVKAEAA